MYSTGLGQTILLDYNHWKAQLTIAPTVEADSYHKTCIGREFFLATPKEDNK